MRRKPLVAQQQKAVVPTSQAKVSKDAVKSADSEATPSAAADADTAPTSPTTDKSMVYLQTKEKVDELLLCHWT